MFILRVYYLTLSVRLSNSFCTALAFILKCVFLLYIVKRAIAHHLNECLQMQMYQYRINKTYLCEKYMYLLAYY